MKFTKKIFSISLFLLLIGTSSFGQQVYEDVMFDLNTYRTDFETHKAKYCGKLTTGFKYTATTQGKGFKGMIDRSIYAPPSGPFDPVGTNPKGERYMDYSLPVGSILGSGGVSSSGAYTYMIPINVPPGTAGMEPQVSLSYNSNGGNGLLGNGWGLSASSTITRTSKDIFHDDKVEAINLINDPFVLSGNRLVALSGNYGANGTRYGQEFENFSEIHSYGQSGKWTAVVLE